jgi:hypothetical protein
MQARLALVLLIVLAIIPNLASAQETTIPSWIKNNAKWWAEDKIGDSDFSQGIQYLVNHGIMKIPQTPQDITTSDKIPAWIKNNAGWWADGKISDTDFISGIRHLIKSSVIKLRVDSIMKLSSAAFENNSRIPVEYTCDGQDISPPLSISGVPTKAKSLALVMDDPDAVGGTFTHWIIWNISSEETEFMKGEKITYQQGKTSAGITGYIGPCPPSGIHRYIFKLYAINSMLDLKVDSTKKDLESAMTGKIVEQATLVGKYSRR